MKSETIAGLVRAIEISKQYRQGFDTTSYAMAQAAALRGLEKLLDDEIQREQKILIDKISEAAQSIVVDVSAIR